jgi:hypothetical protein
MQPAGEKVNELVDGSPKHSVIVDCVRVVTGAQKSEVDSVNRPCIANDHILYLRLVEESLHCWVDHGLQG